jgi:UDP-GlcNAc:undecaprenyl-phosphate GlcNAc-1-phosphate transferase
MAGVVAEPLSAVCDMTSDEMRVALAGVAAFDGAVVLVPLMQRLALRLGITDLPGTGKIHTSPTPYLGGVAIALGALASSMLAPRLTAEEPAILMGAVLVGLAGLVDDVDHLRPAARVCVEAVAASLVFTFGVHVRIFSAPVDLLLTVGWLVLVANSFNLLDNMDGAASVVACVVGTAIAVAAMLAGQVLVGALAAAVTGACLGFLLYNWHPARIFMGDAGSLFVGFLLGTIALKLRLGGGPVSRTATLVLLVGAALFDTAVVVISRYRSGRPVHVGGTDHTAHRLLRAGLPVPVVLLIMATGAALSAGLGVVISRGAVSVVAVVLPLAGAALVALVALLRLPGYEDDAGPVPVARQVGRRPAKGRRASVPALPNDF